MMGMQVAQPPEVQELHLNEYDDQVIMVSGYGDSEWIWSAEVIEVAGPILQAWLSRCSEPLLGQPPLFLTQGGQIQAVTDDIQHGNGHAIFGQSAGFVRTNGGHGPQGFHSWQLANRLLPASPKHALQPTVAPG
jgi:hypothetical protein